MAIVQDSLEKVLSNEVVFRSVYEMLPAEDTFNIGDIFKVQFTKVYQCFDLYHEGKVLEAVGLIINKTFDEVLKLPANNVMRFMKWLESEIKKCSDLLNSIPSVVDMDMQAAGSDRMNEIGEFAIYRSITNDPREWKGLGEIEFELMYVKLLGDGIQSVIQRDYNEIIKNKK